MEFRYHAANKGNELICQFANETIRQFANATMKNVPIANWTTVKKK